MISLVESLDQLPRESSKSLITFGVFDGVHQGHRALFRRLKELSAAQGQPAIALTFGNHPSELLRPQQATRLISHPQQRYRWLLQEGIARLCVLTFTPELANLEAEPFLQELQDHLPFSHLVLGHNALFGKGRAGNPTQLAHLARAMGFQLEYLPAFAIEGQVISSGLIRQAISEGRFADASLWLGRPYSLSGYIVPGHGRGRQMGFPTLNVDVSKLHLPRLGVYAVQLLSGGQSYKGVANLGCAPTVLREGPPLLEVHLFHPPTNPIDNLVEVIPTRFLRPEMRFRSLEELRYQIAQDIAAASP